MNFIFVKNILFFDFYTNYFWSFYIKLDAGKIYQTWPLMNNYFFPDDLTY